VREYWLVDAWAREMVVFELEGGRFGIERVFAERDSARSLVIEGLELAVADVMP
jgi:Uma2 family endonuclease